MSAASVATRPEPLVRPATPADAADLARLVDLASEGLARRFWAELAEPGEDVFAVGARRAARGEGAFSWRNAAIAEMGGAVAGGLVSYRLGDAPEPVEGLPAVARPLVELENRAPGSHYVNVLATYAAFRGRGVATALLRHAARAAGAAALSLIVADGNATARRLYEGFGFVERARRPIVKDGWESASREWVLMTRPSEAEGA
jgi:ribosomal protein S18 acetylase RimI-like enzyme